MSRCQRECHRFEPDILLHFYARAKLVKIMFKIYYTADHDRPNSYNVEGLTNALAAVEALRQVGYKFVTLVSDYEHMTGAQGAKMSGTEYVPQMLNP